MHTIVHGALETGLPPSAVAVVCHSWQCVCLPAAQLGVPIVGLRWRVKTRLVLNAHDSAQQACLIQQSK